MSNLDLCTSIMKTKTISANINCRGMLVIHKLDCSGQIVAIVTARTCQIITLCNYNQQKVQKWANNAK